VSEYQYYEFLAVDRPLTEREMQELRAVSSRAVITPTRFTNHYEWGNFKGDPRAWMERYFDAFLYFGTDERYLSYLVPFIKPGGFIGVVDIAFTRELRSIEDAPEYLRPQYAKHWSYVHSVDWWKLHWEKTGLVELQCAELLAESDDLLRDYVLERPPEQNADSIMRAVPRDHEGLIALFCLVARKR